MKNFNEQKAHEFKEHKEHKIRDAFKAALPITLPVMVGYVVLGMSYGILMTKIGYGALWSFSFSFFVYAGSIQYVGIALLAAPFNPVYTLLITLAVNARHTFYGISMLEKFKGLGEFKPYMIFGLTDETYSLLSVIETPKNVDKKWFYFFVTGLNQFYWVGSTVVGALLGFVLHFNTEGLDFALTALFTVLFIDQWQHTKNHIPALVGVFASVVCLLIFGAGKFMIPALLLILLVLTAFRKTIEKIDGKRMGAKEERIDDREKGIEDIAKEIDEGKIDKEIDEGGVDERGGGEVK